MSDYSHNNINMDGADTPRHPTDAEKHQYYVGLPSNPILVARTSTDEWVTQPDTSQTYKTLEVVGDHAIQDLWNDETGPLRHDITGCLEDIKWNAIDILRVAYHPPYDSMEHELDKPVTMLVSVEKDSTEFNTALATVMKCQDILRKHGVPDIHVEMKEASLVTCSSDLGPMETQLFHPPPNTQNVKFVSTSLDGDKGLEYSFPFSQHLGTQIAADHDLKGGGTKGVYLQGPSATYVMTCRHVVISKESEYRNVEFRYTAALPSLLIMQPSQPVYDRLAIDCSGEIDTYTISIKMLSKQKDRLNPEDTQVAISGFQKRLSKLRDYKSLLNCFESSDSRTLGHLEFSPPIEISHQVSDQKRLRDWALIKLDATRLTSSLAELKNTLPASNDLRSLVRLAAQKRSIVMFSGENDITLRSDTMLESELKKNVHVIKYGQKTKYTLGVSNGVHSVLRHPLPEGNTMQSSEWCIVGEDGKAFSDKGDSGSCVFDLYGRVGGMLTSGLKGENGACDTTYVTPIEWLLRDIRSKGYDVRLA